MTTANKGQFGKASNRWASTSAGLPICGRLMRTWATGISRKESPTCNRVAGHDGPHRHYNAKDFAIEAEE